MKLKIPFQNNCSFKSFWVFVGWLVCALCVAATVFFYRALLLCEFKLSFSTSLSLAFMIYFNARERASERGKRFWIGSSGKRKIQFKFIRIPCESYAAHAKAPWFEVSDCNLCWRSTGFRKVLYARAGSCVCRFVYSKAKNKATINNVGNDIIAQTYHTNAPYKPLNDLNTRSRLHAHTNTHSIPLIPTQRITRLLNLKSSTRFEIFPLQNRIQIFFRMLIFFSLKAAK